MSRVRLQEKLQQKKRQRKAETLYKAKQRVAGNKITIVHTYSEQVQKLYHIVTTAIACQQNVPDLYIIYDDLALDKHGALVTNGVKAVLNHLMMVVNQVQGSCPEKRKHHSQAAMQSSTNGKVSGDAVCRMR